MPNSFKTGLIALAFMLAGCVSTAVDQSGGVQQLEELCQRQPESALCQEN